MHTNAAIINCVACCLERTQNREKQYERSDICWFASQWKSSFYFDRFQLSHIRLSLDMLGTRRREHILFGACLEAKQPVVIDNTNPTRVEREKYI